MRHVNITRQTIAPECLERICNKFKKKKGCLRLVIIIRKDSIEYFQYFYHSISCLLSCNDREFRGISFWYGVNLYSSQFLLTLVSSYTVFGQLVLILLN